MAKFTKNSKKIGFNYFYSRNDCLLVNALKIVLLQYKHSNMSTDTNITLQTPVTFTAGAISEINRLMAEPDFDQQQRLRVGVKGGGCSGMTYVLGFDVPKADDEILSIEGIPCCMEKSHQIYVYGMEID